MRILFDVTHPANVHLFKHLIRRLIAEGCEVAVASRDKDVTLPLLDAEGIGHTCLGHSGSSLAGLASELLVRAARLRRMAADFRPDVMVQAEGGVSIGPVGALMGVPRVVFAQVDRARLQSTIGLPFATTICSGSGYRLDHGRRHVRFDGFQTQVYLDPRRFKPDPDTLLGYGLDPDERMAVVRLVGWGASHDVGRKGLAEQDLLEAFRRLSRQVRILVTSESQLTGAMAQWQCPVPPVAMHHLLGLAALCLAEGGTMGPEAGLLGTPAVTCNSYDFGYLGAMEERGIIRRAASLPQAVEFVEHMLGEEGLKERWKRRAAELYASTDDVLEVMHRVVIQAGESHAKLVARHPAMVPGEPGIPAPPTRSRGRRTAVFIAKTAICAMVLFWVIRELAQRLTAVDWSTLRVDRLLVFSAFGCQAIAMVIWAWMFYSLLCHLTKPPYVLTTFSVAWISRLGRYIPGKVATTLGLTLMMRNRGVSAAAALGAAVLQQGLWIVLWLVATVPLTLWEPVRSKVPMAWLWCILLCVAGAACLHPRVFLAVANRLFRRFGGGQLSMARGSRLYAAPGAWALVNLMLAGSVLWLVACSVMPISIKWLPLCISAMAFSGVSGYLAFFAPGGLGVQEGLILLIMTPIVGHAEAGLVTVLLRLVQTAIEFLFAGVGVTVLRFRPPEREIARRE